MSKPLMGGGAVMAVLLSASFLFSAEPSVAETLVEPSQVAEQTQQKTDDAAPTSGPANASADSEAASAPPVHFTATAYSLRGRTASGQMVRRGVIAADRRVLPIGTRVRLSAGNYSGEYVVADTGGAVKGRKIDVWVPSTREALNFGRRPVKLTVLTRVRPRTATRKKGH